MQDISFPIHTYLANKLGLIKQNWWQNCNAWFTFSLRVLVKTFKELWTRWDTHECRHSHSCARTTRQVQLSKVTRQWRNKKKFSHPKVVKGSRTEWECNHSTFDNEARHSYFLWLGTDLLTCFRELRDETKTCEECETRWMYPSHSRSCLVLSRWECKPGICV